MKRKKAIRIVICLAITLLVINLTGAHLLACFSEGEVYKFCNNQTNYNRCGNYYSCTSDGEQICMSSYNETRDCYNQGSPNVCNDLGLKCSTAGNTTHDSEPPIITLIKPVNNHIYNKRTVLFSVNLNEKSDLYYLDLINDRGRWTRVCQDCSTYSKERSFKEGWNNLTIKAEDLAGNPAFKNVSFFVDSKKPQIHKTEPRNGFVGGEFFIQYSEDNLAEIKIYYGNSGAGMKEAVLSGCDSGKKQECDINIKEILEEYEEEEIEYWFNVKDIAGNNISSKKTKLIVDTISPDYEMTYNVIGKYVYVKFDITEKNFDSIEYIDLLDPKSDYKTLCSSLKNGICEKKITLKAGPHKLRFEIMDKATNKVPAETDVFVIV